MSYSGGGVGGSGQLKGKSAPLRLPDIGIFTVGHDKCSSTHCYNVVQKQYFATKKMFSHLQNPHLLTGSVITVRLSNDHRKNAVFLFVSRLSLTHKSDVAPT